RTKPMWTAKRILLLVLGAVIFITAYAVYAYFLGVVDGLPPLPAAFLNQPGIVNPPPPKTANTVDQKLQQAVGPDCEETRFTIKMEVRSRGLVLATNNFSIEQGGARDGQVKLEPFSVAIYGKAKGPDSYPEINTIQSDVAYLTFDQPIKSASD